MGYKQNKALKSESGCIHNPKPYTKRGLRRHANRNASEKAEAEQVWAGGKPSRKTKSSS